MGLEFISISFVDPIAYRKVAVSSLLVELLTSGGRLT